MAHQEPSQVPARQPGGGACGTSSNPNDLNERQKCFAAALLDPGRLIPHGLVGPDRQLDVKRFNVYRNNVVAGLVDALKAAFPAVRRIVGDEFFAAMARVYVALEPPKSPIMLDYGETFPDFIRTFEPATSVPYLTDIARLERAWVEAYHAAEAPPADPARLATLDPRSLPWLGLTLHPSVRVVRSSFPVVHLWLMNIDGGVPAAIDLFGGGEDAVVVRPAAEVEVRVAGAGAAAFILGLAAGAAVADATALALDENAGFDLAGTLRELLAINAIVEWKVREGSDSNAISGYT